MGSISRRDFLKFAGTAGAICTLAYTGQSAGLFDEACAETRASSWMYTACNMCGGQTGIKVRLDGGTVAKIEPSEYNPIGIHNISTDFATESVARGGRMCVKGNCAVKSLYDPDRLKTPMVRNGSTWRSITWDEAVALVATRLTEIKNQYGAESVAWFSEDHSFVHIQQDFCLAYGTPNYHNHSNLCDVSRKASFKYTLGNDRPLPDAAHAKYILLFGWNPLDAVKWAHLPAVFLDGINKNGAKMVVVDPVFSKTAARGHEWVPIRPGTDGALALAICSVLISENLYDSAFVTSWGYGFNEFAGLVAQRTPEWAEGITGVKADTTRRIARELAAAWPNVLIDSWSGPGQQANAVDGGRAIACIAGLLGAIDRPGCLMFPDRKGGLHRPKLPSWPKITAPRIDGRGTTYPFAHSSGVYVEARESIIKQTPYPVKAGVFVFQNFMMSIPNVEKSNRMMEQLELVIVHDTHMSETAEKAHIVIPGSHALERYDLNSNWLTFRATSLRQPVVASWIGGMPEYEFWIRVAHKMWQDSGGSWMTGFDDGAGGPISFTKLLDDEVKGGMGITLAQMKDLPGAVWIGGITKYERYNTAAGFATRTKKFQFSSPEFQERGLNPLPDYTPAEDTPTAAYPFYFVSWKPVEHTHTRTQNNVWLMETMGDNPVWINARTAKSLGIEEGDAIVVDSPYGSIKSTARLTQRIHPEVVGYPRGFGHWALGSTAKGRGTHDGLLIAGKADPISGQVRHKECAVRISRA